MAKDFALTKEKLFNECLAKMLAHISKQDCSDSDDRIRAIMTGGFYTPQTSDLPAQLRKGQREALANDDHRGAIQIFSTAASANRCIDTLLSRTKEVPKHVKEISALFTQLRESLEITLRTLENKKVKRRLIKKNSYRKGVTHNSECRSTRLAVREIEGQTRAITNLHDLTCLFFEEKTPRGRPDLDDLRRFILSLAKLYMELTGKPFTSDFHINESSKNKKDHTPVSHGQTFVSIAVSYINDVAKAYGSDARYTEKNVTTASEDAVKALKIK